MPKLWRIFIVQTFMLTLVITCGLICLLGLLRPEDLTKFAAISSSWKQLGTYLVVLVPYLLPIALPLGCLFASALVAARIAAKGEWLALTSAGISPWRILCPIVSLLVIFGALNAFIASETIERAHRKIEDIRWDLAALKPLRALQPEEPLRMGRLAVGAEGRERGNVTEILFGYLSSTKHRTEPLIGLINARKLHMRGSSFDLEGFSHIYFQAPSDREAPSLLVVQQAEKASIQASLMRTLLIPEKKTAYLPIDRQSLRSLLHLMGQTGNERSKIISEIFRRVANGALPVTLGLLGLWGGCRVGLCGKSRAAIAPTCFAALTFLSIFMGKSLQPYWPLTLIAYILVQLCASTYSIWRMHRMRVE